MKVKDRNKNYCIFKGILKPKIDKMNIDLTQKLVMETVFYASKETDLDGLFFNLEPLTPKGKAELFLFNSTYGLMYLHYNNLIKLTPDIVLDYINVCNGVIKKIFNISMEFEEFSSLFMNRYDNHKEENLLVRKTNFEEKPYFPKFFFTIILDHPFEIDPEIHFDDNTSFLSENTDAIEIYRFHINKLEDSFELLNLKKTHG